LRHSYDFDRFPDHRRRAELERLHRQATVLQRRELQLMRRIGLRPDHRALEVGCGPGFLTGALATLIPDGQAVGLDLSQEMIAVARTVVQPEHPNLCFELGSATELPFEDDSFDLLYSRLVYQHLADPVAALREARRVVRPGGTVCVLDIDDGWLSLHPPSAALDAFTDRVVRAKRAQGGDRLVGRKLAWMMRQVGFSQVRQQVEAFTSIEVGLRAFLELTSFFKAQLLAEDEAEAAVAAVRAELAELDDPVGLAGIFVAIGTVPEPPC
jgi:ubiquinone/menaquinone biosynthesis C-methylase UbiE